MAGRKTKVTVDVGLQFQDAGNSLQKILNNLRTGLTKGEFSNIFGKSFEADLKKYQDALTKVSTFKLTPENTLQYQQAIQELEQSWIRFSKNIETSVASQKLIDPKAIEDAKAKLVDLEKQLATATGGLSSKDVNAKTGLPKKDPNDTSNYTQEVAKVQALRQAIAQQHREITNLEKAQAKQTAVAQQANAAEKALANSREQHEHVVEGLAEAHRKLAEEEALANRQNTINNIKAKIQQYTSLAFTIQFLRQQWTQLKQTYQEVDKQLTSIAMVSGKSQDSLWAEIGTYNKLAQELGKSTTEVLEASKLFYQQGLSTNEVLTLTTESLKLAAIAETDAKTATDYLTTAINGFKLEASQASMVTDTWAELAGRTAVDVEDLAVGISKVASIAQSAGMELQATSAFLTQIIETTREAPETAGTALKTIIARFQELKTAPGALEDGVDANKVEAALKTAGVELRDAAGQFRDFDDVILELSSKWDSLDRNTQRYIATIAAGSRQQSRFIALVDDYDSLVENMAYANNSAGASMEQFTVYNEGLEASIQRSKTAWEGFYLSLNDGHNIVSFVFDTLTKVINLLTAIGPGTTLTLGAMAITFAKAAFSASVYTKGLKGLAQTIPIVTTVTKAMTMAQEISNALRIASVAPGLAEAGVEAMLTAAKISEANATFLLTKFKNGETIATWELVAAQLGLNLALLPYIVAITAVVAIIGLLVYAIHRVNTAEERRIKQLKEEAAEAQEVAQQEQELLKTYEDLADRLDKVATGEENLEDVRKALIAQFGPMLNGINLMTASYEELNAVMEQVRQQQEAEAAASHAVAYQKTFAASEASRINDIRNSSEYQETKQQLKDKGFTKVSVEERGFNTDSGYQYLTQDLAESMGFDWSTGGVVPIGHVYPQYYQTEDGQTFPTIDEAATHQADLIHNAFTEYQGAIMNEADALAIASHYIADFNNPEMFDATQQQLAIEGVQQGLIELEEITEEIDGEEVVIGYRISDEGQDVLQQLTDLVESDAYKSLSIEAQTALTGLATGEISWSELSSSLRTELTTLAESNTFVNDLVTNWEADFQAQQGRIADMMEVAGISLLDGGGKSWSSRGTSDHKAGSTALDVLSTLGYQDGANLDLNETFMASFNALADDPEAQQAYADAIEHLVNNTDVSLITPEMIASLQDEEGITTAFTNMLDLTPEEIDQQGLTAYFDALRDGLGRVDEAYLRGRHAVDDYIAAQQNLQKATKNMSLDEMSAWIWETSLMWKELGYASREAAIDALWANTVSEDGITLKQQEGAVLDAATAALAAKGEAEIDAAIQTLIAADEELAAQEDKLNGLKQELLADKAAIISAQESKQSVVGLYHSQVDGINEVINAVNVLKEDNGEAALDTVSFSTDYTTDLATTYLSRIEGQLGEIEEAQTAITTMRSDIKNRIGELEAARKLAKSAKSDGSGGSGGKSELERQRELLEKQKEILEAEGDAQEKRIKLIQEELKARKDALKEEQEALKDAFEQQQEQWEIRLEYVRDTLEAEREALEEAANAAEDAAQKEIDAAKRAAEGKINLIQMQIDAMDEEADAENRLLELQKARDEYERARTSKTRLVLTKGAGWIFKTDNAQVEDAAANLNEVERDYQKSLLEAQIAEIEKVVESMEDVEGLLGMTADEIAAMNEATKKWSDYIINGTFADEVATQIGTSVVDSETGVKKTDPAGVAQAAINASQAVADWAGKFEPVLEALEAAIEKVGTSMEDMLLDTEAEEKALDDFFNQIVGAGGTNEILSTLDGTMVEVEASQREMAEKSASIDETIKQIDEDLEAWDEQLDLIGLSTSEIEETRKQVEEFKAATLDELGKNGKYYAEIAATLKDLAAKWEQYNIADRNLQAQEDAEKGYSSGGVANFRGRAMLHGSTSRPEVVLNNSQAAALFNWVNGLGSGRYDAVFDSLGRQIGLLERQLLLLKVETATGGTDRGDTYNFGTINIDSDANSIEQLVTDIRRYSPLIKR